MKEINGRILDMLRSPDGRIIPGEFFPHLIKEVPSVLRFQVIQERLNSLNVLLVCSGNFSENDQLFLRNEIMKVTGDELQLNFRFVEEIPLTTSGKHRVTINAMSESG